MSQECEKAFEAWIKTIEDDSDFDPSTADAFEQGWEAAVNHMEGLQR